MPIGTRFHVTQLSASLDHPDGLNIAVTDLESLVTHHPIRNLKASVDGGEIRGAERPERRSFAVMHGEIEEVRDVRVEPRLLRDDQTLLVKDFILENRMSGNWRAVDVPAPSSGRVGRVVAADGIVDIVDADGRLIARVRHLDPIVVSKYDDVVYGQSLGTQNKQGLPPGGRKHVHLEMDIRYEEDLDNYIRDLSEGRLPVEAEHRVGVQPRPRAADATLHVGESAARVGDVQRALAIEADPASGGRTAAGHDGVYRLSMQPDVVRFQARHGLDQTGDIDWPTWRRALEVIHDAPLSPPPVIDSRLPAPYPPPFDRMHERIRQELEKIEAGATSLKTDDRERLAHALVAAAAERRMEAFDHLIVGVDRRSSGGGQNVFLVRGRLEDPAQVRVCVDAAVDPAMPEGAGRAAAAIGQLLAERALPHAQTAGTTGPAVEAMPARI